MGPVLYRPLQPGELRLVVLLPASTSDGIECQLVHRLRSEELNYSTLSYMWGDPKPSEVIRLDGIKTEIRRNLWAAPRELRDTRISQEIWIDALCINQNDISERNAQVAIMGKIYREAAKVLIWLGESEDGSDAVFRYLNKYYQPSTAPLPPLQAGVSDSGDVILPFIDHDWVPPYEHQLEEAGNAKTTMDSEIMHACVQLCYSPYWRRVWVIQEMFSATFADILCGSQRTSWSQFGKFIHGLLEEERQLQLDDKTRIIEDIPGSIISSPAFQIICRYKGSPEYCTYELRELLEVCMACESQCFDIRDRIYGITSIMRENKKKVIHPDYSKTEAHVYADTFLSYLSDGNPEKIGTIPNHAREPGKDLVYFTNYLQQIIGDPLWDKEIQCFRPVWDVCLGKQLQLMSSYLVVLTIRSLCLVEHLGVPVTPGCALHASSFIE